MSEHSKKYDNPEEFRKANKALGEYQLRHNIIRKDYEELITITESFVENQIQFDALFRASLKSFFSLIESDIYGLNEIHKYIGYEDRHSFDDKFKKTFKNICATWNKPELISKYLDHHFGNLISLKKKRDRLIHPKKKEDILKATFEEFEQLKKEFENYKNMLHSLMDNFFMSIEIKDVSELKNLF
ncbi:MAG: hypothetical protein ABI207_07795 [Crocinitomicaceae bacterium]